MKLIHGSKMLTTGCLNSSLQLVGGRIEISECLQKGATIQAKVDNLGVQKYVTVLLFRKVK